MSYSAKDLDGCGEPIQTPEKSVLPGIGHALPPGQARSHGPMYDYGGSNGTLSHIHFFPSEHTLGFKYFYVKNSAKQES